jgi:hypothetical protein
MALDQQGAENLFNHVLELWVNPELEKRIKEGLIDDKFRLHIVQVVTVPDKKPIIRFNDEARGKYVARLKPGVLKKDGEEVYTKDLESIYEVLLPSEEQDYGHLTMMQMGEGNWSISFDFRMNKTIAQNKYNAGLQFLDTSKLCKEKGSFSVAIDTLFSALELFVTSQLIVTSEQKYAMKQNHHWTRSKYFDFISLGNDKPEFRKLYTDLYNLRDKARYQNKAIDELTKRKYDECLATVEDIRERVRLRVF